MGRRCSFAAVAWGVIVAVFWPAWAVSVAMPEARALKVCAPPYSLPMSDKDESGYENRIARLFAEQLDVPVKYEWFPQRMGFIRNTLRNNDTPDGSYKCDLVVGVIENFELAATTRPYMRSTWAMVYVKGRGLDFIKSQHDLKGLSKEQKVLFRIGIWDQGPTTEWVYRLGLIEYATPYPMMAGDARRNPGHIIEEELLSDKINLTFAWGPIAGFYAKKARADGHDVVVIPLQSDLGVNFDFQIAMAVRHGESQWREQVNQLIEKNQVEIDRILKEFGVPMLELDLTRAVGDDDDD